MTGDFKERLTASVGTALTMEQLDKFLKDGDDSKLPDTRTLVAPNKEIARLPSIWYGSHD